MAHQRCLQFGDEKTADVKLWLFNPDGSEYDGNPLHLHSRILAKSDFFDAMLSDRWANSDARPLQIKLKIPHNVESYVKCICFMYSSESGKRLSLAGVEEALHILRIALELLFHRCVQECMRYLQAVRWTWEQNVEIRALLSDLQIRPSPDLAARIGAVSDCASDCAHLKTMEEILGELLALISSGATPRIQQIAETIVVANLETEASPGLTDVTTTALVKEIRRNLDAVRSELRRMEAFYYVRSDAFNAAIFALQWLMRPTLCLQVYETVVEIFGEEQDLAEEVTKRGYPNPFKETLLNVLVPMVRVLGNGEAICARSVRLSLLTTWLPVVQSLSPGDDDYVGAEEYSLQNDLVEGLGALIETLPLLDQKLIFKLWISSCQKFPKANLRLNTAFESWYNKLRHAHDHDV